MPSAVDGGQKSVRSREIDGLNDIGRAGATDNERRVAIERAVPEAPRLVIALIPRKEKLASQTRAKVFDVGLRKRDGFAR